jgi:transglycosylase-like protein with SLT domain
MSSLRADWNRLRLSHRLRRRRPSSEFVIVLRHAPRAATAALLLLGPAAVLAADSADAAWTGPAAALTTSAPTHQETTRVSVRHTDSARVSPKLSPSPSAGWTVNLGPPPRELTVPDLAVVVPAGISAAHLSAISQLTGVRAVLAVDGGRVQINGHIVDVLGVPVPAFRTWTPPVTAAASGLWQALATGNLVAEASSITGLGVRLGGTYPVTGAARLSMAVLATAPLGIPGIDAIIASQRASQLGLAPNTVALVSAPGASYATLVSAIRHITGHGATVINLVPVVQAEALPVVAAVSSARPLNYLQLYQDSAALYCPGLSWTVLAAIGEIESGDGQNDGPSTAGALGPMQFMPGTWAEWGTDGFGQSGSPDIMNPFDAVPSATRLLCADGARDGQSGLSAAIYDYNHATWYVSEVLDLAAEYAQEYPPAKGR